MDADAGAEYLASIFGTEKDKWVLCAVYQRLFVHFKFGKNDFIEAKLKMNKIFAKKIVTFFEENQLTYASILNLL